MARSPSKAKQSSHVTPVTSAPQLMLLLLFLLISISNIINMTLDTKGKIVLVCALPLLLWDVVFYILSLRWISTLIWKSKPSSVAVGEATETHGCPRRSATSPDKLVSSTQTLYDMMQEAISQYSDKTALVSRTFVELKKSIRRIAFLPKSMTMMILKKLTYEEFGEEILAFGAGLRALGMKPIPTLQQGETFDDAKGPFVMVIFEDTCKQWTIGLHGAMTQSMTVATCYATLGEDAVIAAVNETQATTLLLNWKKAEQFASLAHTMPTLTNHYCIHV